MARLRRRRRGLCRAGLGGGPSGRRARTEQHRHAVSAAGGGRWAALRPWSRGAGRVSGRGAVRLVFRLAPLFAGGQRRAVPGHLCRHAGGGAGGGPAHRGAQGAGGGGHAARAARAQPVRHVARPVGRAAARAGGRDCRTLPARRVPRPLQPAAGRRRQPPGSACRGRGAGGPGRRPVVVRPCRARWPWHRHVAGQSLPRRAAQGADAGARRVGAGAARQRAAWARADAPARYLRLAAGDFARTHPLHRSGAYEYRADRIRAPAQLAAVGHLARPAHAAGLAGGALRCPRPDRAALERRPARGGRCHPRFGAAHECPGQQPARYGPAGGGRRAAAPRLAAPRRSGGQRAGGE